MCPPGRSAPQHRAGPVRAGSSRSPAPWPASAGGPTNCSVPSDLARARRLLRRRPPRHGLPRQGPGAPAAVLMVRGLDPVRAAVRAGRCSATPPSMPGPRWWPPVAVRTSPASTGTWPGWLSPRRPTVHVGHPARRLGQLPLRLPAPQCPRRRRGREPRGPAAHLSAGLGLARPRGPGAVHQRGPGPAR